MGRLTLLCAAALLLATSVLATTPSPATKPSLAATTSLAAFPPMVTIHINGMNLTLTHAQVMAWKASHEGQTFKSPYGYTPSLSSTVAYSSVFALLTITHLVLAIRFKYASGMATMLFGGTLEVIGWLGRLWSHHAVLHWRPFLMQICCLIIGPVFFSAWIYTVLGFCITQLGPEYSLLPPTAYIAVFVVADVVSLILQAVGGGGAAIAAQNIKSTHDATQIMLAGILFQLATMTVFVFLAIDFILRVTFNMPYPPALHQAMSCGWFRGKEAKAWRQIKSADEKPLNTYAFSDSDDESVISFDYRDRRQVRRSRILLAGVAWATVMIYIRGIYRSVELSQGWSGYVITHEAYFIWLDGFVMVLCMAGLTVAYPGFLLPQDGRWK